MAITKNQQAAVSRYVRKNYDRVCITMEKGQREVIQQHAKDHGESMNAFINRAISDRIARESK